MAEAEEASAWYVVIGRCLEENEDSPGVYWGRRDHGAAQAHRVAAAYTVRSQDAGGAHHHCGLVLEGPG